MPKKYFACVYGAASERIDDKHKKQIEKLGNCIAENGFSLVYGAGATGCMGAVARGVKEKDGFITGVSTSFISNYEEIFRCDNNILVDTMAERKTLMEKYADIFFIAPGGIGTMDEFFQVLTLKYLNRIDVPIVILNLDGFYDSMLALIEDLKNSGTVVEYVEELFEVITDVDENTISSVLANVKKADVV